MGFLQALKCLLGFHLPGVWRPVRDLSRIYNNGYSYIRTHTRCTSCGKTLHRIGL